MTAPHSHSMTPIGFIHSPFDQKFASRASRGWPLFAPELNWPPYSN